MKITFFNALTVLFIALKLTNYIDWSWFWVLSPTLVPLLFSLLLWTISAFCLYLAEKLEKK